MNSFGNEAEPVDAVRLSEAHWRSVFENAAIGIAIADPDGRLLETNEAYRRIVCHTADSLRDRALVDFMPEADRAAARELIRRLREGERQELQVEQCQTSQRGDSIWVLTCLSSIYGRDTKPRLILAVVQDITERRRTEESLEKQSEILHKMFEHLPVMLNFIGEDGRVKLVSREWERVLGWSQTEILENGPDMVLECYPDPEKRRTVRDFITAGTGEWRDFRPRTRDGQTIDTSWAEVRLSDGTTIGIGMDITARKRAEDQLQQSLEQLRALADRLQRIREEERKRVAREIHDELGQALTSIKIEVASLSRGLPAGRAGSILKIIDQTIQAVRRISTDLRPGILDDLGLVAAVEWAAEDFQARTGIACRVALPEQDPPLDPERATDIFRIFQETLTNIARHAGATAVQVRLEEQDGNVVFEVQDDGRGITEGQLSARKSLGILGMRERALLLGGELAITGAAGQGTAVRLLIPLVPTAREWRE